MNILAIEWSTDRGQVACLREDRILATADIPVTRRGAGTLFTTLEEVRETAGWSDWSTVDLFAAGRGPGRYSGMRVALTAAQHLALPGNRPVRAIDSGWALAQEWAAMTAEMKTIWVIGDARRDRVWRGVFACEAGTATPSGTWSLLDVPECAEQLSRQTPDDATLVISAEWDRLSALCPDCEGRAPSAWRQVSATPSAVWIGRLAGREEVAGVPALPPVPLYLHPPVEPRPHEPTR